MPGETLDIKRAAELLGVRPSTIRAWCLRRKLRYFKSGRCVRFRREWLEQFIEQNTSEPAVDRNRKATKA
jgi:excisionase family DNA binding protein